MVHVPTYMYIQYLLLITEHKISTRKSGKCHYRYSITTCVVYIYMYVEQNVVMLLWHSLNKIPMYKIPETMMSW